MAALDTGYFCRSSAYFSFSSYSNLLVCRHASKADDCKSQSFSSLCYVCVCYFEKICLLNYNYMVSYIPAQPDRMLLCSTTFGFLLKSWWINMWYVVSWLVSPPPYILVYYSVSSVLGSVKREVFLSAVAKCLTWIEYRYLGSPEDDF